MGVTFKENVSDIRNSKVIDVIREFMSFGIKVDVVDPNASAEEVRNEYMLNLSSEIQPPYDAVVVAVNHKEYLNLDGKYFESIAAEDALLMDVKGIYRGMNSKLIYWSL
jgi:UDP-N-acetyl-D-galactosamine dehydrogenase